MKIVFGLADSVDPDEIQYYALYDISSGSRTYLGVTRLSIKSVKLQSLQVIEHVTLYQLKSKDSLDTLDSKQKISPNLLNFGLKMIRSFQLRKRVRTLYVSGHK